MNEFEKDVQSKTNDVSDSGLGFIYSFVFFALIFFIGMLIDFLAK